MCWGACGSTSGRSSAWPTPRCSPTAGWTASRCTSGTPSGNGWHATHNPFSVSSPRMRRSSSPRPGTRSGRPRTTRRAARGPCQYDLALNGWELGGGSVRIHQRALLERSFALQGHTRASMRQKFGGMLDAFEYGAPPHGGIAIGIDRWAALLADQATIREVMAFPKTSSGSDLMLDAPVRSRPGPVRGAGPAVRGVSRPGLSARGCPGRDNGPGASIQGGPP